MPLLHCEFHGNFKGEKTDMDLILQKVTFLDQFRYEFGQRFLILLSWYLKFHNVTCDD